MSSTEQWEEMEMVSLFQRGFVEQKWALPDFLLSSSNIYASSSYFNLVAGKRIADLKKNGASRLTMILNPHFLCYSLLDGLAHIRPPLPSAVVVLIEVLIHGNVIFMMDVLFIQQ